MNICKLYVKILLLQVMQLMMVQNIEVVFGREWRFRSLREQKVFLSSDTFRLAVVLTQPPVNGCDGLCLEMWLLGALNDHTPSSDAEVKNAELCSCSPYVIMAYSGIT
jgi:hypothetical protein